MQSSQTRVSYSDSRAYSFGGDILCAAFEPRRLRSRISAGAIGQKPTLNLGRAVLLISQGQDPLISGLRRDSRFENRVVNMSELFWLSDAQMARLEPFFPKPHGKPRVHCPAG